MDTRASTKQLTDKQLLAGCLKGDGKVQESFVRCFSKLIYASIIGVARTKNGVLSQQDIEDLHNTVFLQLFEKQCRKLGQFRGTNGCSLASWIRMISVRTVLDHLRRRKDALAHADHLVPLETVSDLQVDMPSQWEQLARAQQADIIQKGLQHLSDRDQLMIQMHCLKGCSLRQMTRLLKVSEGNIHSVKHRAVKRLKQAVEQKIGKISKK